MSIVRVAPRILTEDRTTQSWGLRHIKWGSRKLPGWENQSKAFPEKKCFHGVSQR